MTFGWQKRDANTCAGPEGTGKGGSRLALGRDKNVSNSKRKPEVAQKAARYSEVIMG